MTQRLIIILIAISLNLISNSVFSQSDVPCGAPALPISSSCSYTTAVGGTGFTRTAVGENVADPSCVTFYASFPTFYQEDTWFSFVAPASGIVHIETEKVTGGYNKAGVALYGGPCSSLTELDCHYANSTSVYPSLSPTGLTPGATYYIRFLGEQSGALVPRPYNICVWEPATPPANDECVNAIPAVVNADQFCNNVTSGTLAGATQSSESIYCSNINNNDDVWFSFVASDDLHYFSLENIVGTSTDLSFSVHPPGFCGTTGVNALGCDATNTVLTTIIGLTVGNTYYVRVWSSGTSSGDVTFDLCIRSQPDMPTCTNNIPAGNTACTATPICNLDGYCGSTTIYTADYWPELLSGFDCGTIENNSFLSFVAIDTVISFWAWALNSASGLSIQFMVFEAVDCASGPINRLACYSPGTFFTRPELIQAEGLTIGNQYYIMIDGNAGDTVDYVIAANQGIELPVSVSASISPTSNICVGESVDLYATGGATGSYTWSPPADLNNTTSDTVRATPSVSGVYTYTAVSTSVSALCPTTMNDFTFTVDPCILPVELISFDAYYELDQVMLNWTTATEINNDYFTIERSVNGLDWEDLEIVNGAGNSNSSLNYYSVDPSPYPGISYYRLKQTDFDGQFVYSKIRSVENTRLEDVGVNIYPNPAENVINIRGIKNQLDEISIYTVHGEDVTQFVTETQKMESVLVLDISKLSQGMYLLKIKNTIKKFYKH